MGKVLEALRGSDDQPSRTAFTPGPWSISGKGTIKAGAHYIGSANWKNREANARLIAAAPELYEALRVAQDALRDIAKGEGAFRRDPLEHAMNVIEEAKAGAGAALEFVDAAIAKATSEPRQGPSNTSPPSSVPGGKT